jgi:hypothetical protein
MFADHDAYIAAAPEDLRPLLVRLRAQLASALPDAEEVIAYKMPGFKIGESSSRGMQHSPSNAASISFRHQVACGRHCRGRAQIYQDWRHLLTKPAHP